MILWSLSAPLRYGGVRIKTAVENGINVVVPDERWRGFGRFTATFDDIGVCKCYTVIRRAASCNRLSGG